MVYGEIDFFFLSLSLFVAWVAHPYEDGDMMVAIFTSFETFEGHSGDGGNWVAVVLLLGNE